MKSTIAQNDAQSEPRPRVVVDSHSHTFLCGHAEMVSPKVFEAVADAQNMRGFAFCCHNPFQHDDVTPEYRMPFRDYKKFLKTYGLCKAFCASHFPQLELLLNMEVDYHPADPAKTKKFIDQTAEFDCVLGSLHYYYELATMTNASHGIKVEFVKSYVEVWKQAAKTGWFQVMTHFDFFKARLGVEWYLENFDDMAELLGGGLEFLAQFNQTRKAEGLEEIALECNTGGLQYGSDPYLPNEQLLARAVQLNIPICLGSDSHQSYEVGRQFKQALGDLQKLGLAELSFYRQKKRCTYSVEDAIASFVEVSQEEVIEEFKQKNPKDWKPNYLM